MLYIVNKALFHFIININNYVGINKTTLNVNIYIYGWLLIKLFPK